MTDSAWERAFPDVPFSDMHEIEDAAGRWRPLEDLSMSQTSGLNPSLYTNYKAKPKAPKKPKK